jgi:hypothetical protein
MKRIYTIYYAIFMSLVTVGIQKAADDQPCIEVAANIVLAGVSSTESQSSHRDQDSPRTKTKKIVQKAYSYHAHGDEPRAGQVFPNLKVSQSATSESLVSIAESSDTLTLTVSSYPVTGYVGAWPRDLSEDALDERLDGYYRLSRSPARKRYTSKLNTLASLRERFPAVRTGLAEVAQSTIPSQEQTTSDATGSIQVES